MWKATSLSPVDFATTPWPGRTTTIDLDLNSILYRHTTSRPIDVGVGVGVAHELTTSDEERMRVMLILIYQVTLQ